MKCYLTNLLRPTLIIVAITLSLPVFANEDDMTGEADNAVTTSETGSMAALSDSLKADKKRVVEINMNLTDKEATVFWPLYDAYQQDLYKINQRLTKVINEYALAYNKGAVLNDTAKKLLNESISIELAEARLKQSYVPKFSKVIPAAKVARYLQIETKIRAIIRYALADAIPLVQ